MIWKCKLYNTDYNTICRTLNHGHVNRWCFVPNLLIKVKTDKKLYPPLTYKYFIIVDGFRHEHEISYVTESPRC